MRLQVGRLTSTMLAKLLGRRKVGRDWFVAGSLVMVQIHVVHDILQDFFHDRIIIVRGTRHESATTIIVVGGSAHNATERHGSILRRATQLAAAGNHPSIFENVVKVVHVFVRLAKALHGAHLGRALVGRALGAVPGGGKVQGHQVLLESRGRSKNGQKGKVRKFHD